MTIRAIRVNEARSRLNAALSGCLRAEWWYAVEIDVGDDPRCWPGDAVQELLLAVTEWRRDVGRIRAIGRTYACVPHEKAFACVLQISYARVEQPVSPQPSGHGDAGGSDQVNAATPARPISPSLCGND